MGIRQRLTLRKGFRQIKKYLTAADKRAGRIEDCPACGAYKSVSPNLKKAGWVHFTWFQSCRVCGQAFTLRASKI